MSLAGSFSGSGYLPIAPSGCVPVFPHVCFIPSCLQADLVAGIIKKELAPTGATESTDVILLAPETEVSDQADDHARVGVDPKELALLKAPSAIESPLDSEPLYMSAGTWNRNPRRRVGRTKDRIVTSIDGSQPLVAAALQSAVVNGQFEKRSAVPPLRVTSYMKEKAKKLYKKVRSFVLPLLIQWSYPMGFNPVCFGSE